MNTMSKYLVILEKSLNGYSAYSPDLPGCVATGRSRRETERQMESAITFHIEGLAQDGLPVPEPTSVSIYLPTDR